MPPANSLPWEIEVQVTYVPVLHDGKTVGFCKPDYAAQIVQQINETDKLQKALQLACYDLAARIGSSPESVSELMQRYLAKVSRPVRGTTLIALMLRERQAGLDLNDEEFAKFCDSYRLSREELRGIYSGEEVENHQLIPLSRILGCTVDEVIEAWKGED